MYSSLHTNLYSNSYVPMGPYYYRQEGDEFITRVNPNPDGSTAKIMHDKNGLG